MSLFLILANYVSALFAVQLLRGDLTNDNTMNFGGIYNSFLAMYQVCQSDVGLKHVQTFAFFIGVVFRKLDRCHVHGSRG